MEFCVEDTVCMKSNPLQIGVVDRTFSNVESHSPNPEQDFRKGTIQKGETVDLYAFNSFLISGIPPKGTALVTWVLESSLDASLNDPVLISETELHLLDRALLFGDVVKRDPLDAMSGTVIQASTTASILQSLSEPYGARGQTPSSTSLNPATQLVSDDRVLRDVPVDELRWANEYEREDVILYNDWVGLIQEIDEDIYVRLANNSVVIPEDCSELSGPDDHPCQINQTVQIRKGNLRRGRWIYGAYDANIEAEGVVCDIRPRSLAIQWLTSRYPKGGIAVSSEPPPELERQELDSGAVYVYDRRNLPNQDNGAAQVSRTSLRRANLDVALGDRLRFRDLNRAVEKYKAHPGATHATNRGTLHRIPRAETLGYDTNVFMVIGIKTHVDVLWQDGSVSCDLNSTTLTPYLDLDNEEEVWPGELVMTKEELNPKSDYFTPARAGIVQSVNAQDRMARVRWFGSSSLSLTRERPTWLLPESYTSRVSGEIEDISLYDLFRTSDLSRGLGDLVVILPSPIMERAEEDLMGLKDVQRIVQADASRGNAPGSSDSQMWIGEVVELGLDGLLTIRLGACEPPREVRVPWECTFIAWSSDQDDNTDGFASLNLSDETDQYDSDDISVTSSMEIWDENDLERRLDGVWRDPDGNEIEIEGGILRDHLGNEIAIGSAPRRDRGVWRDEDGNEIDTDKSSQWSTDDEDQSAASDEAPGVDSKDLDIIMTDVSHSNAHEQNDRGADCDMGNTMDGSVEPQLTEHLTEHKSSKNFSYSNMFFNDVGSPPKFAVLEGSTPEDHHFAHRTDTLGGKTMRQIQKEHKMLRESLPDGAYVRTWESNMNKMRALLLGPLETPYEYAPFVFDLYLDSSFPRYPPEVFFHSWTDGRGPANPNLYEDGKVCLSLLGTWPGDEKNEGWNPGKSSILQIIVSLLGLVLVKEPYFNEAGFEVRVGGVESRIPSLQYSERTFFKTRQFITHALQNPIRGFEEDMVALYFGSKEQKCPRLLYRAIESGIDIIHRSRNRSPAEALRGLLERRVTAGALAPLTRHIESLLDILSTHDAEDAKGLRETLKSDGS